ncbi:SAV_2336 N-terminal domain-related protein [Streptomyces sp. NPDC057199]|uniref:SAV_2336 N-terminal domain-related protein n=1 Tax=Streptomyces sp. NPDC057199 TaxID=3346047 RepID=UPI00362E7429
MADALESLVRALAGALGEDADATAIADALWLAAAPAAHTATEAAPGGDPPEPVPSDGAAAADPVSPPALDTDAPAPPRPKEEAGVAMLYERLPHSRPAPGTPVAVPGGRDLPRAMELRRALRPFKRRYLQGRRSELDLDATVRDYRRTGELTPVLGPSPEPWFELLLVVDASPTMAVWQNTNAEFATLLAGLGAFRRVRTWRLRPGPTPVVTDHQDRRVAPGQAVSSDGRRLVLVISDCVAPGWRRPETWQLLRGWGAKSPVALLNPLPGRLWHRTGLDLPAIRVGQRRPALRNADLTFRVPLLLHSLPGADDADWQALPTLTFSPHSLARWAETFMRGAPQGYDAVLVPRTGVVPSLFPTPNGARRTAPDPDPTEVFLRTGSPSAVRLAALCSPFGRVGLPLMHLIRQQLLPEAGVGDLAELLTSPVVTVQPSEDGRRPVIVFDDATRERLASRLSRRDAWRTFDALSRHIAARAPGGAEHVRATATFDPDSVPPELYPFARASNELLTLLREGERQREREGEREREQVRPVPVPGIPESPVPPPLPGTGQHPPVPAPAQRLPDPEHSTALLIGVSRYPRGHSLPGVDADLEAMRTYLTSPEGWGLSADRCVSLVNPRGESEVINAITRACDTADTVLLYFVGNGSVGLKGQTRWRLSVEGDEEWRTSASLEFAHVAQCLNEARARHAMLILDHDGGTEATQLLRHPRTRVGRLGPRVQVLSVASARGISNRGPLTEKLLRVVGQGIPDGPRLLDLSAIASSMAGSDFRSSPEPVVIAESPSSPAFAPNRAWRPVTSPPGTQEEKGAATSDPADPLDPVGAVFESVQRHLRSALPETYEGSYRGEVNRLLRALLAFAAGFIDGTEQADSEMTLVDAVQDFLVGEGITTEREVSRDNQGVDVVWFSEAGPIDIHIARDGGARSWSADPSVSFELVLDRETRADMSDLVDCVSTVASTAFADGERSCLVTMRLPVPQHDAHGFGTTVDMAEREAADPSWGLRWFTRNGLSDAVEAACDQLLGEAVGDGTDDDTDDVWTLNGVPLPSGIMDLTIQAVTPDTQSIVWDTVEEYEHGLVLGRVTVDAHLVLEGLMNKRDHNLVADETRLLEEVNEHMVEVSVERSVQLVFDARRESGDVELEFRGTNPDEPHPHDPA